MSCRSSLGHERLPANVRNADMNDCDRSRAHFHGLSACGGEPFADQIYQHSNAESLAKQYWAGATVQPCGSEHFEGSTLLCAETTLLRGYNDCIRHHGNSGEVRWLGRDKSNSDIKVEYGSPNRDALVGYLNSSPTIVVRLTQANEIHRNLSRSETGHHLFHFSLRSRCTAMLAGLGTLSHNGHGPD
jgi:hypothetical protein